MNLEIGGAVGAARHGRMGLWHSTVGQKALCAGSGLCLWGWLVLHLLGNLTLWAGRATADGYAARLHAQPLLLWAVRAALVTAAGVHVATVTALTRRARLARPQGLAVRWRRADRHGRLATFAARSMRVGGVLLLLFIAFHIAHLTFGAFHPAFTAGLPYENVVSALRAAPMAVIYICGAGLVGLHLYHGLWSALRSLSIERHAAGRRSRPVVAVLAAALAIGFASLPLGVLAGVLR